ncbi:RICIN domain-containing protein [Streptomyces sp. NBC_00448]|uniref:RICIN domain-containing protein n=1 Tax=Streptomyces sp. NBC_00448 TaxID=2903652 RepID=UPI002E1B123B
MPTSRPPRDPGADGSRPEPDDDSAPAVVVRRAVVMPSVPDGPPPAAPARTATGGAAGTAGAGEPPGSVQPAAGGSGGGGGSASGGASGQGPEGGRRSAARSLPVLITVGVVVAIGATLPFAVTTWQHHGAAPAAQTRDIPSADPHGDTPQTLPATVTSTASPTAKASPHASKKPPAHPHRAAGTPHPGTTGKASGKSAPKHTATPKSTPKKKVSTAAAARARANAASSASKVLIDNVTTHLCADVPGFGDGTSDGPVNQYDCDGTDGDNQLWDLQVAYRSGGPQGASLFVIRNHKDGLCMDLPNYGAEPAGTKIEEFACNRTKADNQLWWLDPRPDGTYWLRDYSSGMCVNVPGVGTGREDARLEQDPCGTNPKDDFRWRFQ